MAAVVFMPTGKTASIQDFIFLLAAVIILVEFFVRILRDINDIISGKRKKRYAIKKEEK
jgi:hypothetical protein